MPRTTTNGLRSQTRRVKRKRTSVITKAKFKPKTARNNRNLIMSNAKAISMLRKMQPERVWTDYQYNNQFVAPPNQNQTSVIFTGALSEPAIWSPCLRQDKNSIDSSTTYWRNMTLNVRVNLGLADYAQWSVFVVTPRKDNNSFSFIPAAFEDGQQYILSPESFNPILNSRQFKVHFVKHMSLTGNAWKQDVVTLGGNDEIVSGNPYSTYRKFQINIRTNTTLKSPQVNPPPIGLGTWKSMSNINLPYYNRYFILCFCTYKNSVNPPQDAPDNKVSWHQLNTCINSS